MRRAAAGLALAVLMSGAVIAYADLSGSAPSPPHPSVEGAASAPAVSGRIKGKVTGLYPGAVEKVRVRVRNRTLHLVRLATLRTAVKDASPACTRTYLKADELKRPKQLLDPGEKRRLGVIVRMVRSAPDACQGARWPLRFEARFNRQ